MNNLGLKAAVFFLLCCLVGVLFGLNQRELPVYGANGYMTGATYGTYYNDRPTLATGQGAGLQMDQNGDLFITVTGTMSIR